MKKNITIKIIVLGCVLLTAVATMLYDYIWNKPDFIPIQQTSELQNYAPIPEVKFTTLNGESYLLDDLNEEAILLHFWASWCITCLVEFPDLLKLVEKFEGKLALISISIDDDKTAMERLLKKLERRTSAKIDRNHVYWVWDENKNISLKQFNITRAPETILINNKRLMVTKIIGKNDWAGKETEQKISDLIEPPND